jgi:hypothetical protein
LEKLKQDYQELFSSVSQPVWPDVVKFICSFKDHVCKCEELSPVEELSETVQNFYQAFAKQMEANSIYRGNIDYPYNVQCKSDLFHVFNIVVYVR